MKPQPQPLTWWETLCYAVAALIVGSGLGFVMWLVMRANAR